MIYTGRRCAPAPAKGDTPSWSGAGDDAGTPTDGDVVCVDIDDVWGARLTHHFVQRDGAWLAVVGVR